MSAVSAVEVIDLLSDNEEAAPNQLPRRRPLSSIFHCTDLSRHVRAKYNHNTEDEVEIVDAATHSRPLTNATTSDNASSAEEDDVCLVGATGPNALEDFPHSRESCVKHPFHENPLLHCSHCYCFVCDVVASDCLSWPQHCHATYGDAKWRMLRQDWKTKVRGRPLPDAVAFDSPPAPLRPGRSMLPLRRPATTRGRPPVAAQPRGDRFESHSNHQQQQQQRLRAVQAAITARMWQCAQSTRIHPVAATRQQQVAHPLPPAHHVLPPSTQPQDTTIYINMSSAEQQCFAYRNSSSEALEEYVKKGGTLTAVQQCLLFSDTTITATTKVNALITEINALRSFKPIMRVVVYTQYEAMQEACVASLQQRGYNVYQVNQSMTNANDIMNAFQRNVDSGPSVLVIMSKSGIEGMMQHSTLTCVFFMEPLLDSTAELQVIGSGQSSTVPVKRFVFRYSIESNIMELREAISSGRLKLANESFLCPQAMTILAKGISTQSESTVSVSGLLEV